MRCLGRLIALGLGLLFVGFFPCSMWTFNTQRIALSGDTYKALFTDEGFYQDLIPAVLPALFKGLDEPVPQPGDISLAKTIDALNYSDWEKIAPELVPADWLKGEVETNLDAFFGWLDGNRSDLVLIFHTDTVRRRLAGDEGTRAVDQIVAALPGCTPEQDAQYAQLVRGIPGVEFPYCQPSREDLRSDLRERLVRAKNEFAASLPAEYDLLSEMETGAREQAAATGKPVPPESLSRADRNRFRDTVRLWQQVLVLVCLIPAALLAMIVIVTVRSARSFFRWMGLPLVIASLFTLVPLVFLPLLTSNLSSQSQTGLSRELPSSGALAAEIAGRGMVRLVVGEFVRPVLEQSTVLIIVGFVFLVLSVLLADPDALPEPGSGASVVPVYQTPPALSRSDTPTRLDDTPPPDRTPPPERPAR